MIWEQYGSALLQALERLDIYNRFQVYGRTLAVVLVVALVAGAGLGVEGVLTANIVGQLLVAAGGLMFLWRAAGGLPAGGGFPVLINPLPIPLTLGVY